MSELSRHRVRVSFDFDVVCNDEPVCKLSYDEGGTVDLALLTSFLVADKGKLLMMLADKIGCELGLDSPESFIAAFLPQVIGSTASLFRPAIDALTGENRLAWDEICNEPDTKWGDYLTLCTEKIFECFSADFVNSSYEEVS